MTQKRIEKNKKVKFEELMIELKSLAIRISKNWGNEFEIDELINEAWISNNHKNEKIDEPLIIKTAHLDMIDYIRKKIGTKFHNYGNGIKKEHKVRKPRYFTNLDDKNKENNKDYYLNSFFDELSLYKNKNLEDKNLKKVDDTDLINFILENISTNFSSVLRKYFLEEKSLIEIGKELNRHDSTIFERKQKGLRACMDIVKKINI